MPSLIREPVRSVGHGWDVQSFNCVTSLKVLSTNNKKHFLLSAFGRGIFSTSKNIYLNKEGIFF